jgi:transposase-like protein
MGLGIACQEGVMEQSDWSAFGCPNPQCSAFGEKGRDTIRPHGWSSKARNIRCLRCTVCGKSFSERAGTPLFRSRLSPEKAVELARHLAEGNGMRPTGRLCGVSLNTVLRFALRAGRHAEAFHDERVRHVPAEKVQADEAWSFVGKKRQAL